MSDTAPIPRVALSREEAASSLGMSLDSFERHVQPTLRLVRLGRLRLVPVAELERWVDDNAQRTLEGDPSLARLEPETVALLLRGEAQR
jgi:hypothetical protein